MAARPGPPPPPETDGKITRRRRDDDDEVPLKQQKMRTEAGARERTERRAREAKREGRTIDQKLK